MNNRKTRRLSILTLALASLILGGCENESTVSEPITSEPTTSDATSESKQDMTVYTVADAMDIASLAGNNGTTPYYVKGIIKSFQNYYYGQITLTDGTNDLPVYGTYMLDSEGKTVYFNEMDYIPVVGDTVTVLGALKTYNKVPEMGKAVISKIEQTHEEVTVSDEGYEAMTIAESRKAEVGTKVRLTGVVALKTHTQKMNYNGFYLIDETGSTFVYGAISTYRLQVGNKVTVIGEIDHFVASNEQALAAQIGYQGSIQITNTHVISNDNGNHEFDKSWVKEKTIKEIMDTDVKEENITTDVFHVTSILKSSNVDGILNYYFDDLDGVTGSYVYSANTCTDFKKTLDPFVNKLVDVYLSPINCKSTVNGAIYRFVPLAIQEAKEYHYDQAKAPQFVLDYIVVKQFNALYAGDPEKEMLTSYSNELIGIDGVTVSYASDNTSVAYFEEKEGKTLFHVNEVEDQPANITVTASLNGVTATATTKVVYHDYVSKAKTVADAINAEVDTEIMIRGVISSKLLVKNGFYLTDDNGTIACQVANKDALQGLKNGDEVIVTGTRALNGNKNTNVTPQINLLNCVINATVSSGNDFSREAEIETTLPQLVEAFDSSMTAKIYQLSVYVYKTDAKYPQILFFENEAAQKEEDSSYLQVYSSNSNQFAFAEPFVGKQVTLETAICNWNGKGYRSCPITLTDADGMTGVNML